MFEGLFFLSKVYLSHFESEYSSLTSLLLYLFPKGSSGAVVTLTGSGFGTDLQQISVTINNVPCNVSTVSDTQVHCKTGTNPGGNYQVMLHHKAKGHAQSDITFTYELSLIQVQPNEGRQTQLSRWLLVVPILSNIVFVDFDCLIVLFWVFSYCSGSFGGGALLTVVGSGFDPSSSTVMMCDKECKVHREMSSSSHLFCQSPFNNGTVTFVYYTQRNPHLKQDKNHGITNFTLSSY